MSRSKIEYCDITLNIITGCKYECEYCYSRVMSKRLCGNVRKQMKETKKYRKEGGGYVLDKPFVNELGVRCNYPFGFEPTLHRYKFHDLDKYDAGQNVLVGVVGDMFGDFVPESWIYEVFENCKAHEKNNYMFLTKNPAKYKELELPEGENMLFGTSISKKEDVHRVRNLPKGRNRFVAIEPIQEEFGECEINTILKNVDWIIIGSETGRRSGKIIPKKVWIDHIANAAREKGIPVFMLDSIKNLMQEEMMRELPEQLKKKGLSEKGKKKFVSTCPFCGKELMKNQMVTMSVRMKRGQSSKRLCHICKECLASFCEEYKLEMPEFEEDGNGKKESM